MSEYPWPVVPLSTGQLRDVRPEDILAEGHFRLCNTKQAGGGYDKFAEIAERRGLGSGHCTQFVVQSHGCNLDCPYCYVTRAGVWGAPVFYTSKELVAAFNCSPASVFHLMGGAPALYLEHWSELLDELVENGKQGWVFHSDLLLTEKSYSDYVLKRLVHPRALYAVNVKGLSYEEYLHNTRKVLPKARIWDNLDCLEDCGVPYYLTFTNCDAQLIREFWVQFQMEYGAVICAIRESEAFEVSIIQYKALAHTDDVPWASKGR